MPGVLIIEALAQAGALYGGAARSASARRRTSSTSWRSTSAKFRKPVVPGDVLVLDVVPLRKGGAIWKLRGEAKVGDALVARPR